MEAGPPHQQCTFGSGRDLTIEDSFVDILKYKSHSHHQDGVVHAALTDGRWLFSPFALPSTCIYLLI